MTRNRRWTEAEDRLLKELYPDYSAIRLTLPNRSLGSIKNRCDRLGVRIKRHIWTNLEVGRMRKHYPVMAYEELEAVIGQPISMIRSKASSMGLVRVAQPLKPSGSLLVDELLGRCRRQGIGMAALDKLAGTERYFQNLQGKITRAGNSRSWFSLGKVVKAIHILGGRLEADWGDDDTDDYQAK